MSERPFKVFKFGDRIAMEFEGPYSTIVMTPETAEWLIREVAGLLGYKTIDDQRANLNCGDTNGETSVRSD